MSSSNRQDKGSAGMPGWFTIKPQRVKYANFSVNKDGVLERPNPSWSNAILDNTRPHHLEPWNVEKVSITGKAIEVRQHAESYPQYDETKGPRVLAVDEFSWSVLFKPSSMKDIHVREYKAPATVKTQQPSTFIELGFKYEGLPESKDSTQAKTVPEEAAMDDAGETEATGAEVDEEVEAGEIEGGEVEGGEVEGEDAEGGEAEGEEADEGAEEEQEEEMEVTPLNPDEFDLAKLFAGPNNFKDLEVRIAFMRSPAKTGRWQWHWPAVFRMLQGLEGYTPQTSKSETQRRHGLSLDEWMSNFGNKNHAFIADPQRDGTTRWKLRAEIERQRQRPSRTSTAVPEFGAPLPKPPDATLTTAPTPAGPSQGPKERTLAEIDAEEEELEREAERLNDRRKQLRLERKQLH